MTNEELNKFRIKLVHDFVEVQSGYESAFTYLVKGKSDVEDIVGLHEVAKERMQGILDRLRKEIGQKG